jgi:hypothetical protein
VVHLSDESYGPTQAAEIDATAEGCSQGEMPEVATGAGEKEF